MTTNNTTTTTTTNNTTTTTVPTENQSLQRTASALDKLNKSAGKSSLDDLVKGKTRRSLLLVDCSGSMADWIRAGGTKIDALRKVVDDLRRERALPVASFSGRGVQLISDSIPGPRGGTPLHSAIDFASRQGANHLVVVTDGLPDSEGAAFEAADRFGGPIDVFYIGDGDDHGARFAAELARRTGGSCGLTDLGKPKELAGKIVALLGDGSL